MGRARRVASAVPSSEERFAAQIRDPAMHVVEDFAASGGTLLVLFGGIAGGVSMPVYEFFRVAAEFPAKKLFVRDPRRAWYLRGLPGVGDTAADVEAELRQRMEASGADRVVMAGASAGGFAANRFGVKLGADRVHAFSPQTFVDARTRERTGDDRWQPQVAQLHAALGDQNEEYDLLQIVARNRSTVISIHVSRSDPLDQLHADRLRHAPLIDIASYPFGGHMLVKSLRNEGILQSLLRAAIEPRRFLPRGPEPPRLNLETTRE